MINDPVDSRRNTFIFYSILSNDNGLTAFLCSKGASLKIRNRAGVCPNDLLQLMEYNQWNSLVNDNDSLFMHCLKGEADAIKDKIKDVMPDLGQDPYQPIVGAIYSGDEKIVRMIIDEGIDVNQKICGKSLLMIAALLLRKNIVAILLQRGAAVDDNPQEWLRDGVLELKKKSLKSNLWLGFKNEEIVLDAIENAHVDQILLMLTSSRHTIKSISESRPASWNVTMQEYYDLELLVNGTVGCCTKLDKIWISMLQSTIKLAKAVMENRKHHFAPLTLKIMNGYSEVSQAIENHLNKLEHKQEAVLCKKVIVQKMKTLLDSINTRKLLNDTRLATGVWPPDHAEDNMIRSFIGMLKSTKTIVLISKVGLDLEILDSPIQFKFEEEETGNFDDMSYDDYRRMNEISVLQNMAKTLKISQNIALTEEIDYSEDTSFLELLDCHLVDYISTCKLLIRNAMKNDKTELMENICATHSLIFNFLRDIRRSDYYTNLSQEIIITSGEMTAIIKELKIKNSTSFKSILRNQMESLDDVASRLVKFSMVESCSFTKLMESLYTCSIEFKHTLIMLKELSKRMSYELADVRKKQAQWKLECSKSEKAQTLLNALMDPKATVTESIQLDTTPESYLLKGSEDEILYDSTEDGKKELKGAPLSRLVDKLVVSGVQDPEYASVFITLFPNITTPRHLFEMLKKRYNLEAPLGINQRQFEAFITKIVVPIRLNICRIIGSWLEIHPQDFSDPQFFGQMSQFISRSVDRDIPAMAISLKNALEKLSGNNALDLNDYGIDRNTAEKIKKALGETANIANQINLDVEIFDIDPIIAGKQLSLLELHLFQKITPDIILAQFNNRNQINEMINHSNDLCHWIACCILSSLDIKIRASYVKYFIQLASECLEHGNLNGLTCIIGGLVLVPISRLHKTWSIIKKNEKIYSDFIHLCEIVSSKHQYAKYRKTLKSIESGIPFLGVYYTDLEFIRIGNPTFLSNSFINWKKQCQVYALIKEIKKYQSSNFPWPKSYLYTYFKNIKSTSFYRDWDEDVMYGISLEIEP